MNDRTARNIRDMVWTKPDIVIERGLWLAFHDACLQRHTTASKEIQRFIHAQLEAWEAQETETTHE